MQTTAPHLHRSYLCLTKTTKRQEKYCTTTLISKGRNFTYESSWFPTLLPTAEIQSLLNSLGITPCPSAHFYSTVEVRPFILFPLHAKEAQTFISDRRIQTGSILHGLYQAAYPPGTTLPTPLELLQSSVQRPTSTKST